MMKSFNKNESGFTLIELVVVVAVLGVLAIVAVPKILGTTTEAREASLGGVAGALTAASTHNYMIRGADNSKGTGILNCVDVASLLHLGTIMSKDEADKDIITGIEELTAKGYEITENIADPMSDSTTGLTAVDTAVDCTLSTISKPVLTTTFSAIGID
jgi:MSHA pilin protein MshA|tara:strand:- start:104 stop:580 length:477 start_codon:yes stop_codon:yes gene_type:complete